MVKKLNDDAAAASCAQILWNPPLTSCPFSNNNIACLINFFRQLCTAINIEANEERFLVEMNQEFQWQPWDPQLQDEEYLID